LSAHALNALADCLVDRIGCACGDRARHVVVVAVTTGVCRAGGVDRRRVSVSVCVCVAAGESRHDGDPPGPRGRGSFPRWAGRGKYEPREPSRDRGGTVKPYCRRRRRRRERGSETGPRHTIYGDLAPEGWRVHRPPGGPSGWTAVDSDSARGGRWTARWTGRLVDCGGFGGLQIEDRGQSTRWTR
jgi:hypothetical protein